MKTTWNLYTQKVLSTPAEVQEAFVRSRGIEDVDAFVQPQHPSTFSVADVGIDPAQMVAAKELISQVHKKKGTVVIFGDYDADGVCATSLLWQTLHRMGVRVWPFIPQRDKHGYGLSIKALEEIAAERSPDLIITVDNGIVAHAAIAWMKTALPNCRLIVTDHHQPELCKDGTEHLPEADVVVHSVQLCGASVAWMLARELMGAAAVEEHLDLAGLATIADQVPLKTANRSFAFHGIATLRTSKRVGLQALCAVASIAQQSIDERAVGFGLAPRINAMGRLAHGLDALRLLCTQNSQAAATLSQTLTSTNKERQDLTQDLFEHALEQAKKQSDEHLIVVSSSEYHEGVIGLIAGRITQELHKPSLIFSIQDTTAKASARSIPGINIVELLREVHTELLSVGGHPMAAGLSVRQDNLENVITLLQKIAKQKISAEQLFPKIELLGELGHEAITTDTAQMLESFRPWGAAHREPWFQVSQLKLLEVSTVGAHGQHLKLWCSTPANQRFAVLGWGRSDLLAQLSEGDTISVAGALAISTYKGKKNCQIILQDIRNDS